MPSYLRKGSQPPADHDYVGWHAWADYQAAAGLKQSQCEHGRWLFPQENCKRHLTLEAERQGKMV